MSRFGSRVKQAAGNYGGRGFAGGRDLITEVERVWTYILKHQLRISLEKNPQFYSIKEDWSSQGMGYMLYAGDLADGVVVGMGSRGEGNEPASSYLGELRGVCLLI